MYSLLFLFFVIVTFILSRSNRRSRIWLYLLTLSYLTTSVYHNLYAHNAAGFSVAADFFCCVAVYALAKEEGELKLLLIFQGMCLVNIFAALGFIETGTFYNLMLEALNYIALYTIALPGALDAIGPYVSSKNTWLRNYIHHLVLSLRSQRKEPPWYTRW